MHTRINILFLCFISIFILLTIRISYLTLTQTQNPAAPPAAAQKRFPILDVNQKFLARSILSFNIYLNPNPKNIPPWDDLFISQVAGLLQLPPKILKTKLYAKTTLLLKRFLPPEKLPALYALNIQRLAVEKVEHRIYPHNNVLSHTIGLTGYNNQGFSGLEKFYNTPLLSQQPSQINQSTTSKKLILNINVDLQKQVEKHLAKTIKKHKATAGIVIVQHIHTGKILAIATAPTFNLNQFTRYNAKKFLNQATASLIEPGSIIKPFFVAFLLEKGENPLQKKYFCKGKYQLKNGETIRCNDRHGAVSLRDIIQLSCNSGIIQAMENTSKEKMHDFLSRFKINQKTFVDIAGEWRGILPPTKLWGIRNKATVAIGHAVAMTPIQLVSAFSALINGGKLFSPRIAKAILTYQGETLLQKELIAPKLRNIVLPKTISSNIIKLLVFGTVKGSTGFASRKSGLTKLFGKTSTSQLVNLKKGGYYTNRYHSIFAGGYPLENPQFAILAIVKDPKFEYYGGKAAAPLFAEVVSELINTYRIPNERPLELYDNTFVLLIDAEKNTDFLNQSSVPNFKNFSLRKTLDVLQRFKKTQLQKNIRIHFKVKGSGFVTRQTPPPGTPLAPNTLIQLFLK